MDTIIVLKAVMPKSNNGADARTTPKKKMRFADHIVHFAHEIIKNSKHSEIITRWHWAIMEKVKPHSDIKEDTEAFKQLNKNIIALAESVWNHYYTKNEDGERGKRTLDDFYSDDEEAGDMKHHRVTKVASLSEMAEIGSGFVLDWNSMDKDVSVFTKPGLGLSMMENGDGRAGKKGQTIEEMSEYLDRMDTSSASPTKENVRPIKSAHSLRKKLLHNKLYQKLQAAAIVQTTFARAA